MSKKEIAGMAIRYLPGVCWFDFNDRLSRTPDLTPLQYSKLKNDPGETHGLRIYQINHVPHVLYDRTTALVKKYSASLTTEIPPELLPIIFHNNKLTYDIRFQMQGLDTFDHNNLKSLLIAVPLEVLLAQVWALLETQDLYNISPSDQFGNAQTNLGLLQIKSR